MDLKLIHDRTSQSFELYDLATDPGEKRNLWPGDEHHRQQELMKRLEEFERISSIVTPSAPAGDQNEVRRMLRSLGYTD